MFLLIRFLTLKLTNNTNTITQLLPGLFGSGERAGFCAFALEILSVIINQIVINLLAEMALLQVFHRWLNHLR